MLTRRLLRVALAWSLLTLAWCAFVIVLAGRLMAQTPGCFAIDRYQQLCIPGDGLIFVDVADGASSPDFSSDRPAAPRGLTPTPAADSSAEPERALVTTSAARIILAHQKIASDGWIDRSQNKKGERCCDSGKDCWSLAPERVKPTEGGVNVTLDDGAIMFVPGREIMPSEDGKYWLCIWAGQRKCFFAPYSGS